MPPTDGERIAVADHGMRRRLKPAALISASIPFQSRVHGRSGEYGTSGGLFLRSTSSSNE